jgi:hypothetical protein
MSDAACHFVHFGLIVTGETEREHLPKLFKSLMATGVCHFKVIRFIGQRDPITSSRRKLKMVGSGKLIPDKDVTEIGLPARKYIESNKCSFVVLIDDLEHHRKESAQQVFARYRRALDTVLSDGSQPRASVHFLVNMLEAYYFADANAINLALNLHPPLSDYAEDVEKIRNPKSELKQLYPNFNEIEDGDKILEHLDIVHILSRPETCAWLRTLFAWCVEALEQNTSCDVSELSEACHLRDGPFSPVTYLQCIRSNFCSDGE